MGIWKLLKRRWNKSAINQLFAGLKFYVEYIRSYFWSIRSYDNFRTHEHKNISNFIEECLQTIERLRRYGLPSDKLDDLSRLIEDLKKLIKKLKDENEVSKCDVIVSEINDKSIHIVRLVLELYQLFR